MNFYVNKLLSNQRQKLVYSLFEILFLLLSVELITLVVLLKCSIKWSWGPKLEWTITIKAYVDSNLTKIREINDNVVDNSIDLLIDKLISFTNNPGANIYQLNYSIFKSLSITKREYIKSFLFFNYISMNCFFLFQF